MVDTYLTDKILHLIDTSSEPLTGREMYKILSRDHERLIPGDVACRIWALVEQGLVKVRTDLKVVRV